MRKNFPVFMDGGVVLLVDAVEHGVARDQGRLGQVWLHVWPPDMSHVPIKLLRHQKCVFEGVESLLWEVEGQRPPRLEIAFLEVSWQTLCAVSEFSTSAQVQNLRLTRRLKPKVLTDLQFCKSQFKELLNSRHFILIAGLFCKCFVKIGLWEL